MHSAYHKEQNAASAKWIEWDTTTIPMPWTVFIEGGQAVSERLADEYSSVRPAVSQTLTETLTDSSCGRGAKRGKIILKLGKAGDTRSSRHAPNITTDQDLQSLGYCGDASSAQVGSSIGHAFTPVEGLLIAALVENNSEEQSLDSGTDVAFSASVGSIDLGSNAHNVLSDLELSVDSTEVFKFFEAKSTNEARGGML